ncbi:ArsR/SmtB family transcription factor [Streptomyces qinglanensis]|uniref:ArsR/SmtB family transcription factor n=1 Tax=Streptomyces qinglanensis TaxID=943816 RepID=UPI003D73A6DE
MLHIHLTGHDLGRIRIADRPALMWETMLSLHWLPKNTAGPTGARWRAGIADQPALGLGMLREIVPPQGYFPDFLTPYDATNDVAEALDTVLRTPVTTLRTDLELLPLSRRPSRWMRDLAIGHTSALNCLGQLVRTYHSAAVAPFWQAVREGVAQEHLRVSRLLASGGTEALLSRLSPLMRWRSPVLQVDYPVCRDVRLEGRGLLLIPSHFCQDRPITLVRQDTVPVLVYPFPRRPHGPAHGGDDRYLADLLGRSRAAVLRAAARGGSTSEIARRADVLVSSASQHLAVLRRAGLVTSHREAGAVMHRPTALGTGLLRQPRGADFGPAGG